MKPNSSRLDDLLDTLRPYELLSACFSGYLRCVCQRCQDPGDHQLVWAIENGPSDWMAGVERSLEHCMSILGDTSVSTFVARYRFDEELCPREPTLPDAGKVDDILSGVLFLLDFERLGLRQIRKLDPDIRVQGQQIRQADYVAEHSEGRLAIEVKTIRTETWASDGAWIGSGTCAYWWGEMFVRDLTRKLMAKDGGIIAQLTNTAKHYQCTGKMLAISNRRASAAALMTEGNYALELEQLAAAYPAIDYICVKENDLGRLICRPKLPGQRR